LVAALVVAALGCKRSGPADGGGVGASKEDASATAVLPFDLYFPAPAGRLRAERRELRVATDSTARASVLVAALLEGPTHEGLAAPLPAGVEVGTVYLSPAPDRVLYLEFRSASLPAPPASGSEQELQTVYSVVDTVLLNIPEIRRVVLLWNGSQRESFAGHVDTASALGAREALIDRS
jgi:hypothetical protein